MSAPAHQTRYELFISYARKDNIAVPARPTQPGCAIWRSATMRSAQALVARDSANPDWQRDL